MDQVSTFTQVATEMGRLQEAPLKPNEVPHAIERLEYEITELEAQLSRLTDRLSPVLGLTPPMPGHSKAEDAPYAAPLAGALDSFRYRITNMRSRVADLCEQVQL